VNVLVAGGAGLLGAAAARQLLQQGQAVLLADTFDPTGDGREAKEGRVATLPRGFRLTIAREDLSDAAALERLFAEQRPAAVVNAARFAPGRPGARPLMDFSRASGVGLFVHLSDGALYGASADPTRRAREDEALSPGEDPHLSTKAAEEAELAEAGIPYVILRVFDPLGPGPVTRFPGEALEAILADEEVFLGDDLPRDFIHPEDVGRGVALALARRPIGEAINLGSGTGTTPGVVLKKLAERSGKPLRLRLHSPQEGVRPPRIADMEKAWARLGFSPGRVLDDMVDEIVRGRAPGAGLRHRSFLSPAARWRARDVSRRELFDLFRRPFGGRRP